MRQGVVEGCRHITSESLLCCSAAPPLALEGKVLTAGIACQASPLHPKKLLRLTWLPSASRQLPQCIQGYTLPPVISIFLPPLYFISFLFPFLVSFISLGINVFVYETFSHSKEFTTFLTLKIHCLDLISRKFETFNEQKIWTVKQHS